MGGRRQNPAAGAGGALGSVRVLRELGTGSHGTVYEARTERELFGVPAGTTVAVKFLRQELVHDPKWIARLRQEAEIGRRIDHPNVVRIFGIEETRTFGLPLVWLLMEYVEGRTLRALLDTEGQAVERLVRRVGADVARGLQALHENGVVHRDIKPENLHLSSTGHTKLMDLGLAGPIDVGSTGSGTLAGTLLYAAPECLRGKPATAASELYSLGVVLYELATGSHPFAAADNDPDALISAHLDLEPPTASTLAPRLSPFLDHVLRSLLQKARHDRLRNATELATILEAGEASTWWQRHERTAPVLQTERRLRATRRPTAAPPAGRDEELAVLQAALQRAREGEGNVLHLRGPEGGGKRRLVDEFVERALRGNRPLLYFAGAPATRSKVLPLSPIGGFLVEHYARGQLDSDTGGTAVEKLATRFRLEADAEPQSALALARWLLQSTNDSGPPLATAARVLRAIGNSERPLLLRIEHAERLNPHTVTLLEHAVTEGAHLVVVLCSHSESRPPDLGSLPRRDLAVDPLDAPATQQLFEALFANPGEGRRAARLLTAHLPPVPGLLIDALADLAARGDLVGQPGAYQQLSANATLPLSPGLEGFVLAAWDRLEPQQREVIEAAAVLGARFRTEDLADVLQTDELAVLGRLGGHLDDWLLSEGELLRFRRVSQRSVVLGRIHPQRRIALHERAARVLEAAGADALEIGMQWSRAGRHERALPPLLDTATRFLARANLPRARPLLRRVRLHVDRSEPANAAVQLRALLLEAQLEAISGNPARARTAFEQAISLARDSGDRQSQGLAWLGLAAATRDEGWTGQAMALARGTLDFVAADSDTAVETLLLLGELEGTSGSMREGLRTIARAHEILLARDDVESPLFARATTELARHESACLRVELAERHYRAAEAAWTKLGDEVGLAQLHLYRSRLRLDLGQTKRVRNELTELVLPTPRERAVRHRLLGLAWHFDGDNARALEDLQVATELATAAGETFGGLSTRIALLQCQIELECAHAADAEALEQAALDSGIPRDLFRARRLHARILRDLGSAARSLDILDETLEELRLYSLEPTLPLGLLLERARSLEALGRLNAARSARGIARRRLERLAARLRTAADRKRFLRATPVRRALMR